MVRPYIAWVCSYVELFSELSNTEAELTALFSLEENMASELRYLQQRYDESTFNRTWKGQSFILMRHATGFYCIFRSLIVSFYDRVRDLFRKN